MVKSNSDGDNDTDGTHPDTSKRWLGREREVSSRIAGLAADRFPNPAPVRAMDAS